MTSCSKFCVVASITNEDVVVASVMNPDSPKKFPIPYLFHHIQDALDDQRFRRDRVPDWPFPPFSLALH
jgi:hypothetical protein